MSAPTEQNTGWGTPESPQGEGYWDKASGKKLEQKAVEARPLDPDEQRKMKRTRRRKILLYSGGGVLLLILILLALAPTIVGSIAPGIIEKKAKEAIKGTVKVDRLKLAWGGPQIVGPLHLKDESGSVVADITVETDASLFSLAAMNFDLGEVRIKGNAAITREADGKLNIQRAVQPVAPPARPAPKSGKPATLPKSLSTRINARGLQVVFTDRAANPAASVTLRDIDVKGTVQVGKPLDLRIEAAAMQGAGGANATTTATAGSIDIRAKVERWSRDDGTLTPDAATVDAEVLMKAMPSAVADVLAAAFGGGAIEAGAMRSGLGDVFDVTVTAQGSINGGTAGLSFRSKGAEAAAKMAYNGKIITTDGPVRFHASGDAVKAFVPQIQRALGAQGDVTLAAMPGVTVTVDKVRVPFVAGGKSLDLRGAAAAITVTIDASSGTVRLQSGGEAKPFTIGELKASVETDDLANGAAIKTDSIVTVDGKPAGVIAVDLRAMGLLDAAGGPSKGLPALSGKAGVKGIATAIAQPFVQAFKIDLPNDVGPTLDIELTATPTGAAASAGSVPPTRIDLAVKSANITLTGALRIETNGLFGAMRLDAPRGALLARHFVAPETGYQILVDRPGALVVSIPDFSIPCTDGPRTAQVENAAMKMEIVLGDWGVRALDSAAGAGGPVVISELSIKPTLAPGAPPKVTLSSSLAHGGRAFTMSGGFDIPGLLTFGDNGAGGKKVVIEPAKARPVGSLDIKTVPMSLLAMATAKAATDAAPIRSNAAPGAASVPLDLAKLITDAVGGTADIKITSAKGATAEAIGAAVEVVMARLKAEVKADISATRIDVKGVSTDATISPEAAETLVRQFAPTLAAGDGGGKATGGSSIRLLSPARFTAKVSPLSIPLDAYGKPDWAKAGELVATIGVPGRAVIDGLSLANADGTKRALGPVGIENFQIDAKAPLAGAMPGGGIGAAIITATGSIISKDQVLLALTSRVQTQLSAGKPAGSFSANVSLASIDAKLLGALAGQEGKLAAAVGDLFSVDLGASIVAKPGREGDALDFRAARIDTTTVIDGPRLKSDAPIRISLAWDRLLLDGATTLTLEAHPELVNPFLNPPPKPGSPPPPADQKPTPTLTLVKPAPIRVALQRLVVSMPGLPAAPPVETKPGGGSEDTTPASGPMKPGVFDLLVTVGIADMQMAMSDGVPVRLTGLEIETESDPKAAQGDAPIAVALRIAEAAIGDKLPAKNMKLDASITGLADANGVVTPERAKLSANGDLPTLPVALIDAIANQNGMLLEALGPIAGIKIRADNLPLLPAKGPAKGAAGAPVISNSLFDLTATSDRATAKVKGAIRDNVFISEEPVDVTVVELTQALAAKVVKGLPMLGTLEKGKTDAPGKVVGTGMTVPLSDDFSKLNGEVSIDPGEAKFGTSSSFGKLLKTVSAKGSSTWGKNLGPMLLHIKDGVATYDKYTVPLGEFAIESNGTVNLVKKEMDVVTWIPIGALTDEAIGAFKTSGTLGTLLGKASPLLEGANRLPFRTKGHLDHPETRPDLELFAKEVVSKIKPEKLIEQGLGDLLKGKTPPPK